MELGEAGLTLWCVEKAMIEKGAPMIVVNGFPLWCVTGTAD